MYEGVVGRVFSLILAMGFAGCSSSAGGDLAAPGSSDGAPADGNGPAQPSGGADAGDATDAGAVDAHDDAPTMTSALPVAFTKRLLDPTTYPTAHCNDGTMAGYYPSAGSAGAKGFVIFLDGGSWCSSDADCATREKDLSSSSTWPATMTPDGVLSSNATQNPHFAGLNRVYVPYCTSDVFSGDAPAAAAGTFEFRGRAVLDAVIADLVATYGLGSASSVLFAGASAGGISVLVAADRVAAALPGVKVVAVADAGFLPDVAPLVGPSILTQFETAVAYWNGHPDDSCAAKNPGATSRCYLAQYAQPEITTPLFFGQNLEDPHGPLHSGGFTWPATPSPAQVTWMNDVYTPAMTKLLAATPPGVGFYSPCQVVHTMIDNAAWYTQDLMGQHYDDAVSTFFAGGAATRLAQTPCKFP